VLNGKEVPFTGNTLKRLGAAIREAQTSFRHQILHGTRHQDFARVGECRYARTDMNGK
jgi:hypothetical protein